MSPSLSPYMNQSWIVEKIQVHEIDTKALRRQVAVLKGVLDGMLFRDYLAEWEVIDKLKQHPEGYTFNDWLTVRYPIYGQLYKE